MNAFVTGKMLSPEIISSPNGSVLKFGLLNGRTATEFTVFEYQPHKEGEKPERNKVFDRAADIADGSTICAVVAHAVTKTNTLGCYLRDVTEIDESFVDALRDNFR